MGSNLKLGPGYQAARSPGGNLSDELCFLWRNWSLSGKNEWANASEISSKSHDSLIVAMRRPTPKGSDLISNFGEDVY